MEKDINQLIIKEFKKRITNLEKEVQNLKNDNNYLRGRLDQLVVPNLNIEKYTYPIGTGTGQPYWKTCGCNPENGGSGVCGCTLGNTIIC